MCSLDPEERQLKVKRFLSSVKIVYRKTTALTKIVIATAVVLSIAAILTLRIATENTRQQTEALRQEAILLEQEEQRLELYIRQLGTVQGIMRIAQERLGLVEPDSVIIQPE